MYMCTCVCVCVCLIRNKKGTVQGIKEKKRVGKEMVKKQLNQASQKKPLSSYSVRENKPASEVNIKSRPEVPLFQWAVFR